MNRQAAGLRVQQFQTQRREQAVHDQVDHDGERQAHHNRRILQRGNTADDQHADGQQADGDCPEDT